MKTLIFLFSICLSLVASAQSSRQTHFLLKNGVAVSGYDPVSYFMGKPQKGKSNLSYVYNGITYKFSQPSNLNTFKKSPEKYEPAYGGWCAYAMGERGAKVEIDPENYRIYQGKLYLFYKDFFSNTLNDWKKDEARLKKQADAYWSKIFQ